MPRTQKPEDKFREVTATATQPRDDMGGTRPVASRVLFVAKEKRTKGEILTVVPVRSFYRGQVAPGPAISRKPGALCVQGRVRIGAGLESLRMP